MVTAKADVTEHRQRSRGGGRRKKLQLKAGVTIVTLHFLLIFQLDTGNDRWIERAATQLRASSVKDGTGTTRNADIRSSSTSDPTSRGSGNRCNPASGDGSI